MDPLHAKPEPVETISERELTKVLQSVVLHEAFKTYYGRRPRFAREGKTLLCKTPAEVDHWVSDVLYRARGYSRSMAYRPMLPEMVDLYSHFVWGPGSWTGEEPSFGLDNPAI